jgi:hypothetical protein
MARYEQLTVTRLDPETGNPGSPFIPVFLLATVPDAAAWEGHLIRVSDATPPALCFSDGTNWVATDDGTTVA